MPKHDDDNIPVLEDVIHEYDSDLPDAPATNEKQKALWDDDDDFGTAAAVTTADSSADEYTWNEPAAALDNDVFAGELPDDTVAITTEAPVDLLRHDEHGDTIGKMQDSADDGIEAYMDDPAIDELELPADNASSLAEQIDIDELSERILLQLIPDLEDYLHDRIRRALETALKDRHRD